MRASPPRQPILVARRRPLAVALQQALVPRKELTLRVLPPRPPTLVARWWPPVVARQQARVAK